MNPNETADICFVVEGTYPYVPGGVSSWIHQALTALPEFTFHILFLGSQKKFAKEMRFELPPNVLSLAEGYLFEPLPKVDHQQSLLGSKQKARFYEALSKVYSEPDIATRVDAFWNLLDELDRLGKRYHFQNLCDDEESWDLMAGLCEQHFPGESFVDLFYTHRFLHAPIWKCIQTRLISQPARVYHSVSTGYAGLLAAMAARRHGGKLFITEHGIYVKERIAEINQAKWLHDPLHDHVSVEDDIGAIKRIWIEKFKFLAHVGYEEATTLTTLYRGNENLQIEFGARKEKIQLIPNGIRPERFAEALEARTKRRAENPDSQIIGFVGRVVSIKDVKSLIRAMALVNRKLPKAELVLMGPTDEEQEYFEQCQAMVKGLNLGKVVHFVGRQDLSKKLGDIDVMVLTSISEGLPFVILEGYACKVPCVSTDVGACRELIFGNKPEDFKIGPSGILTKIATPDQTAQALIKLLSDQALLEKFGEAGYQRLMQFYQEKDIMGQYAKIYRNLGAFGTAEVKDLYGLTGSAAK